jgi:hypothetical protein
VVALLEHGADGAIAKDFINAELNSKGVDVYLVKKVQKTLDNALKPKGLTIGSKKVVRERDA